MILSKPSGVSGTNILKGIDEHEAKNQASVTVSLNIFANVSADCSLFCLIYKIVIFR